MFVSATEAGTLERAYDLVNRLHLEKSYDLAMTIADVHRKLVDKIEDAKFAKFGGNDDEEEDMYDETPTYEDEEDRQGSRITPDSSSRGKSKRPFPDFGEGARKVRSKVHA